MVSLSISGLFVSLLLLCAPDGVSALVPDLPHQTSTSDELFDPRGWTPRPTDPPNRRPQKIFARQNFPDFPGDAEKVLVAPDNTCGYVSGLQGAPYSCGTEYKCLFFSATGDGYGPVACCTTGMSCAIRTACVNSADYFGSQSDSACDAGCRLDLYTLKCTEADVPYCGGIRFKSPNIQDYWCVSTNATSWHEGHTTYINQTQQRAFTTVDKADLWLVSVSATLTSTRSSTSTSRSVSATSSDGTVPSASSPATPAPAGAIVGGVLGGIAILSLSGFGVFFLWRRFRTNDKHHELSGEALRHDPFTEYRSPNELSSDERYSYSMTPVSGFSGGAGAGYARYDDPHKPQELYTPPIAGAKKVGQYTQVAGEDQDIGLAVGGHYAQHNPLQMKPSELESRQDGVTPVIGRPPQFPPGEGHT